MSMSSPLVVEVQAVDLAKAAVDAVIVPCFEGAKTLAGVGVELDKVLGNIITDELKFSQAFSGKLGETWVLNTYGKIAARYVVVVGLGNGLGKTQELKQSPEPANITFALRRAAAASVRVCQKLKVKTAATAVHTAVTGLSTEALSLESLGRVMAEGALLGSYQFKKHKTTDATSKKASAAESKLSKMFLVGQKADMKALQSGVTVGTIVANATNDARDLVFDAPNHVTPDWMKDQAKAIKGLKVTVLDRAAMTKKKMNTILLVAQGSEAPAYLVQMSYASGAGSSGASKTTSKAGKGKKSVALVGKGITFDSGGLSLKPAASMELMKMDMAGAAAVLGTLKAVQALDEAGYPLNVTLDGFFTVCENMPNGQASKPGDIVTTYKGKTVEVNNTDAEGRLILCDTLTYAQEQTNPDELIDLATLTGAQVVALGEVTSAVMTTSKALFNGLQVAGEVAGEKYWELPMFEEYKDCLKSDVADMINSGSKGKAGTIAGAMFLKEFIDDGRAWAHIDIAGPAYTSSDQPEVPKGATGVGVRTLLYYLYQWA